MPLNILQYTEQPPQQRILQSKKSLVARLKHPGLSGDSSTQQTSYQSNVFTEGDTGGQPRQQMKGVQFQKVRMAAGGPRLSGMGGGPRKIVADKGLVRGLENMTRVNGDPGRAPEFENLKVRPFQVIMIQTLLDLQVKETHNEGLFRLEQKYCGLCIYF